MGQLIPIKIRRGTKAELDTILLDFCELCFTTDEELLYIGNGVANILVGGSGDLFTNLNPTIYDVGGILEGETFTSQTLSQMLNRLLYNPTFTNFEIIGQYAFLEVGNIVRGDERIFIWDTANPSSIVPNTIKIEDITASVILLDLGANTGEEIIDIGATIKYDVPATHIWQISAQNTIPEYFTKQFIVEWKWKLYFGFYSNSTITSSDILTLKQSVLTYTYREDLFFEDNTGNNYLYFCFPESFGNVTHIFNPDSNFDMTSDFTYVGIVSHTNEFLVTTNYHVWRSTYPTYGTNINISLA